tara:strand:- start:65 stop:283 length:219 start_codon:yes stop_codon:yes gene_type:complete
MPIFECDWETWNFVCEAMYNNGFDEILENSITEINLNLLDPNKFNNNETLKDDNKKYVKNVKTHKRFKLRCD